MCHDAFNILKKCLAEGPILKYPNPEQPYSLFTDAGKYAWACALTQACPHVVDDNGKTILLPITYMSGLFRGRQVNWATLTKEEYVIYMSIKRLSFYWEDTDITLRNDHLPLQRFLEKNTLNS